MKAFTYAPSWLLGTSQLSVSVKNEATVDAHGYDHKYRNIGYAVMA
jgi:hypothetical protein